MSLQIGEIRITFMSFIVCLVMCIHFGNLSCNGESHGVRRTRGVIKEAAELVRKVVKYPVMRWIRVRQARKVMLTDAKLEHKGKRVTMYEKLGGKERAEMDYWLIDAYDVKEGYAKESGVWMQGMVGDYVVVFQQKHSDEVPYPAISMLRRNTRERSSGINTIILYRTLN